MLTSLSVQNIVLIKNISIFFGHRLSVFTGETGAGKSILLDALSLALGGKFSSSIIRTGENFANVSAVFSIEKNHAVFNFLNDNAIPFDNKNPEVILRRTITLDGKSKSFINDIPVSLAVLKTVGESLVEIHGQFDNQGLMNPANHIKILDIFAGLDDDLDACKIAFSKWKDISKKRVDLEIAIAKAKTDEEYIRYNLDELKILNPQRNEETELSEKRKNFLQNK
ncbi:MAG: AAA family ATPase, partial [Rickettsiales bacterium]|nr:AAA family ATPase [Rickettsiales bacterium]